jgi:hypothetical protein
MYAQELLEEIIEKEFRGLCISCAHDDACNYRNATNKHIIQCEMYELDNEANGENEPPRGLCVSCDNAAICKLPGRKSGVWHCNEYA